MEKLKHSAESKKSEQDVIAEGKAALERLRKIEIPVNKSTGTGSLSGNVRSYNPIDAPKNHGKVYTMREHLMAQKYNRLQLNALGNMCEVLVSRQESEDADRYGLAILMTSDGTIVNGAVFKGDNKGQEDIKPIQDMEDLTEQDWAVLALVGQELDSEKLRLNPFHEWRTHYPQGLDNYFYEATH